MKAINPQALHAAQERQSQLTKPMGSLGRLEDIAIWFAGRSGNAIPKRLQAAICVFAADHGVAAEGVSAFPAEVTAQMVTNFMHGGAAISVLARENQISLSIVDVGVKSDYPTPSNSVHGKLFRSPVCAGTANLRVTAAMSEAQMHKAWQIGVGSAMHGAELGKNLLIGGEMGIANTTSAAALICALTDAAPEDIVGLGTGIQATAHAHKIQVVKDALQRARAAGAVSAHDWLREVGGLEIAALAGFYTAAAEAGIPVLLDGFITTAAALVAVRANPAVGDWLLASHASQEQGHRRALAALDLTPVLDLGLRLGEASGAALALPIIQSALTLHREMATFTEAGVAAGAM
ncbi:MULTISPECIES: nicotinate-nucleotide--dimethylbenzimidazole phosphoribosyltransferase [Deefgea]|uniref:Nicotinate-nucleotide--dimethylbenzimidazole phosphoribosyltransferase n=1 Tax=Deefgea chitinilytica TaxID=570276 RepID=A0ABS2CGA7_9NEIS|nr:MULTISPECIES: nicotinate-nucleotide--dimethylbenzimidazole phosphoribosyltransferase [Deefgea]MBM5572468.1 nicotinate-nucleotide--dimethylbenzimidazole phosphoribosyltransferase [Deefgea chitinilytica]MBM9889704.1 nicotinate-nucleotide--dimethylbenzimidazole phosphoribosyltransferase [Deefgea sp. CFH1-16]